MDKIPTASNGLLSIPLNTHKEKKITIDSHLNIKLF